MSTPAKRPCLYFKLHAENINPLTLVMSAGWSAGLKLIVSCVLSLWEKLIIPVYRLWLHGLYGLYGTWCPLSEKGKRNQSLTHYLPYTVITIAANTAMLLTEYDPNLKINQELIYLLNECTHAYMMLYDISINSSFVINVTYFLYAFLT